MYNSANANVIHNKGYKIWKVKNIELKRKHYCIEINLNNFLTFVVPNAKLLCKTLCKRFSSLSFIWLKVTIDRISILQAIYELIFVRFEYVLINMIEMTNDKMMFKIEYFKVCCPFIHSHYNKDNGNNDKFFKYNTLQ